MPLPLAASAPQALAARSAGHGRVARQRGAQPCGEGVARADRLAGIHAQARFAQHGAAAPMRDAALCAQRDDKPLPWPLAPQHARQQLLQAMGCVIACAGLRTAQVAQQGRSLPAVDHEDAGRRQQFAAAALGPGRRVEHGARTGTACQLQRLGHQRQWHFALRVGHGRLLHALGSPAAVQRQQGVAPG